MNPKTKNIQWIGDYDIRVYLGDYLDAGDADRFAREGWLQLINRQQVYGTDKRAIILVRPKQYD